MAYSTDKQLYARLSEGQVQRLTDEMGSGTVDRDLVARLRRGRTEYINAWLRGHYALPLDEPTPPLLAEVEVSLLAARLYSRRPNVDTPEGIRDDRKEAVDTLTKIAAGKIDLGIEAPEDGAESGRGGRYSYRASRSALADEAERL